MTDLLNDSPRTDTLRETLRRTFLYRSADGGDIISEPPRKAYLFPFRHDHKCLGFGYCYDGTYGYMGTTSHLWDWYSCNRTRLLGWCGLMMVWNCNGTGRSHIERQRK